MRAKYNGLQKLKAQGNINSGCLAQATQEEGRSIPRAWGKQSSDPGRAWTESCARFGQWQGAWILKFAREICLMGGHQQKTCLGENYMAMFESDDRKNVNLNLVKGQVTKQNCPSSTQVKVIPTLGTQNRHPVSSRTVTVHAKPFV